MYVKRNNSSLIPLLQSEVEGKIISIYNKNINETNPIKTLCFENTNFALEKGPISVYINNIFAGEAMLPFLDKGGKGKVSFAVEQAIKIKYEINDKRLNQHAITVGRDIYKKYFRTKKTVYNLDNLSDEEKEVQIEHIKSYQYKLFESPEPEEESRDIYVFTLKLEPKEKKKFVLKERKVDREYVSSGSITLNMLDEWKKLKLIKDREYNYLKKSIELQQAYNKLIQERNNINNKIQTIFNEQDRIRQNIASLKETESEMRLREKYIKKMDNQEDSLEENKRDLENLDEKLKENQEQILNHQLKYIEEKKKQQAQEQEDK